MTHAPLRKLSFTFLHPCPILTLLFQGAMVTSISVVLLKLSLLSLYPYLRAGNDYNECHVFVLREQWQCSDFL